MLLLTTSFACQKCSVKLDENDGDVTEDTGAITDDTGISTRKKDVVNRDDLETVSLEHWNMHKNARGNISQ